MKCLVSAALSVRWELGDATGQVRTVGDITAEVAANDAMPCGPLALVKLYIPSEQLLLFYRLERALPFS